MNVNSMAVMEKGSDLIEYFFELGEVGANECVIKIETCGVCYSDVHLINDNWKITKYPLVPGHEVIGKVIELGSEVLNIKAGDRVGVGWQRNSCFQCKECLSGNENYCQVNFQTTTGRHFGGFASHIKLDSRFTFPIPKNMNSKLTSPLLCAGAAVYSGLRAAGMTSGQNIGIIGLGGLGHLAVQFAHKLGNKVTIFEYDKDRAELAYELGAEEVIITKDGIPKSVTNPLNIMINTVHHPLDLRAYLRLLDVKGTLNLLANSPTIEIPYSSLVYQQKRILGSVVAGRSEIVETLDIASRFKIEAYVEEYHLQDVNEAISALKDNKLKYRAVLTI